MNQKFDPNKSTVSSGFFSAAKGGTLFKDIFKKMLRHLNIGYSDTCCNDTFTPEGSGSSYKVYTAIVEQIGTDAPTAIVLENTTGITPIFTYQYVGGYYLDFPSLYLPGEGDNKIAIFYNSQIFGASIIFTQFFPNTSTILINSSPSATFGPYTIGVPTDGLLNGILEVRVYP